MNVFSTRFGQGGRLSLHWIKFIFGNQRFQVAQFGPAEVGLMQIYA
jgi:hypothetical protein